MDSPHPLDSPIVPFPITSKVALPPPHRSHSVARLREWEGEDPRVHTLAWLESGWRVGTRVYVCATGHDCVLWSVP